jgi:hypothetical protein
VINLFRDEDKRGKKFAAKRADRKGNFANDRSTAMHAKFSHDRTIAHMRSESQRYRSEIFAAQRDFVLCGT